MTVAITLLSVTSPNVGNFSVPHGISTAIYAVAIQMTSTGEIWLQPTPSFDSTNLYLTASDFNISAQILIFAATA